jgi:hypothetical protein
MHVWPISTPRYVVIWIRESHVSTELGQREYRRDKLKSSTSEAHRTLLPRHNHPDAHDCVHASPGYDSHYCRIWNVTSVRIIGKWALRVDNR